MVIELDRPTKGVLLSGQAAAQRISLALAKLDVPGDMQGDGAGLIKAWRVDEAAGAAQIRLDLAKPAVVRRRFLLPPGDGVNVYRYVIDVTDQAPTPPPQPPPVPPTRRRSPPSGPASRLPSRSCTPPAAAAGPARSPSSPASKRRWRP